MSVQNRMRAVHPGEILREEYLVPLGMDVDAAAASTGIPASQITAILAGELSLTVDISSRLARAFSTSPGFWANLQAQYDLRSSG